ncbi:MAG TPA: Gfo/Idh/MocA family oxidoreductase [Phycisphaerae bacterium]|nr:Gfo/Idh/MocA family oxidoreductase [Phycisphaerae bacterium]
MAEFGKREMGRRSFLKAAVGAAGTAGLLIVKPGAVRGLEANSKVEVGVIGCGGRGRWIANLFAQNGNYQVVAVHDYFQDRADGAGNDLKVDAKRRHTGLGSYKDLLAGQVDAVAIISPPYFHPEQAAAAVEAGKHVYLAKPVAVDAPGCNLIGASGKKAAEKKRVFLVDFQTRVDPFYTEALKRVHEGAIGRFAFGEASYHCGRLGTKGEDKTPEGRLRNWVFDKALSGDIITEQNIHTLDVMNWILQVPPLRAWGKGGRKVRVDVGDCWDHFVLVFEYADDVAVSFSSRQFAGHGTQPDGIRNRMFGDQGVLETAYGGQVLIRGKNFYRGGSSPRIYQQGAIANVAAFGDSIRNGKVDNPTVAPSVQSNLITVMGRVAAYTGKVVTWEETVNSTIKLDGRLDGLKA